MRYDEGLVARVKGWRVRVCVRARERERVRGRGGGGARDAASVWCELTAEEVTVAPLMPSIPQIMPVGTCTTVCVCVCVCVCVATHNCVCVCAYSQ